MVESGAVSSAAGAATAMALGAALVAVGLRGCTVPSAGGSETPSEDAPDEQASAGGSEALEPGALAALRAELLGEKLAALCRRAEAAGLARDAVEEALDADDPKVAMVELLLKRDAPAAAEQDASQHQLLQELQALTLSALRKRAISAGSSPESVDDAMDADDAKGMRRALIALIVRQQLSAEQVDEVLARLKGGGKGCAEMIGEVLDHAMSTLEQLSASSPRKARRSLLDLSDRAEDALQSVSAEWCDGVSRCAVEELTCLCGLIESVREVRGSSTSTTSTVSDAVAGLLDGLDRCGSPVLQSLAVLTQPSENDQRCAGALSSLELLRGLSEIRLDVVCPDEVAAFKAVWDRLAQMDLDSFLDPELVPGCMALVKLGLRNGAGLCGDVELCRWAADLVARWLKHIAESVGTDDLLAGGAAVAIKSLVVTECGPKMAPEARPALEAAAHMACKSSFSTAGKVLTDDRALEVISGSLTAGLLAHDDTSLACGCCCSVGFWIGYMHESVLPAADQKGLFGGTLALLRRVELSPMTAEWWVKTCDVVDAASFHLTCLWPVCGLVKRLPSPSQAQWWPELLDRAMTVVRMNVSVGLSGRETMCFFSVEKALPVVEIAAQDESQQQLLVESGVADALEYGMYHDFTYMGMSVGASSSGAAVALVGRNEGGKTLRREAVHAVLEKVWMYFHKSKKYVYHDTPVKGVLAHFVRIPIMAISDANKRHMLLFEPLVDMLLSALIIDDDNCRKGQAGTDALQEASAGVLQELSLFAPGAALLKAHPQAVSTLHRLCEVGTKLSQERAAAALFELEEEKRLRREATDDGTGTGLVSQSTKRLSSPHVMVSYNWDHQDVILRVVASLQERGYLVWVDTEQMKGATVDTMALAVEGSSVVLIGVSRAYKESSNCRMEAQYALQKKKALIPLMLVQGYEADGWLGLLLGSSMWYAFYGDTVSSESSFASRVDALVREIGGRGRADASRDPGSVNQKPEPDYESASEPQPEVHVDDTTRADLEGLRLKQLCDRAMAECVGADALGDALDAHNPKAALIDVLAAHMCMASKAPIEVTDETDADTVLLSDLTLELRQMRLMALYNRALAAGVQEGSVDDAMESDTPKSALIDLIVAVESCRDPVDRVASCLEAGEKGSAKIVSSTLDHAMDVLSANLVSSPRKARKELVVLIDRIANIVYSEDAEWCDGVSCCSREEIGRLSAALVAVEGLSSSSGVSEVSDAVSGMLEHLDRCGSVVLQTACAVSGAGDAGRAETSELQAELASLRLKALEKRALAEGIDTRAVEDALDEDSPKAALIKLIVAMVRQRGPTDRPLARLSAGGDVAANIAQTVAKVHSKSSGPQPEEDTDTGEDKVATTVRDVTSDADAGDAAASRLWHTLRGMTLLALQKRACSIGISDDVAEDAMESMDPKASLMNLIVDKEVRFSAADRMLACLEAGGEDCVEMIAGVLHNAIKALDILSVASPRKSRKVLMDLMERTENRLENVDIAWCQGLLNCGVDEKDGLSNLLASTQGLSSSSQATDVSDAVTALLESLDRCGNVILQSTSVLSGAATASSSASVLSALESLRGLSQEQLDAASADEALAHEAVLRHLSCVDACCGVEVVSSCMALFTLGCRNGLAVCGQVEVVEAASDAARRWVEYTSTGGNDYAAGAAFFSLLFLCGMECGPKMPPESRGSVETAFVTRGMATIFKSLSESFTEQRAREVFFDSMKTCINHDDVSLACGWCVTSNVIGYIHPGAIPAANESGLIAAGVELDCLVEPVPLANEWWVKTCAEINVTSARLTCLWGGFFPMVKRLPLLVVKQASWWSKMLERAVHLTKVNEAATLSERDTMCFSVFQQALGIVELSAQDERQHERLLASGVTDALEYAILHDFTYMDASIAAYASGAGVALVGRNEGGKVLRREAIHAVLTHVHLYFRPDTHVFEAPAKTVGQHISRLSIMTISDANKQHMLSFEPLIDMLLNCLVLDNSNHRRGQEGADMLQEMSAGVLHELSLFGPGAAALRSHRAATSTLHRLRELGTKVSRERGAAALFELEEGKRAQKQQSLTLSVSDCEKPPPHVMVSYNWDHQDVILRVVASLQERGYLVWVDTEQMKGATVDTMALAVEGSSVVLIGVSRAYKESSNCRMEAQYALQKKKALIPLMLVQGYEADGWLGLLLGSSMWYAFYGDTVSSESSFASRVDALVREIGGRGRVDAVPAKQPKLLAAGGPLREELQTLRLSALKKRARAADVPEDDIEEAEDADDPKVAFIELVAAAEAAAMAPSGSDSDLHVRLRDELQALKMSQLKRHALAKGVTEHGLEEAEDADSPREAIIKLVLQQE